LERRLKVIGLVERAIIGLNKYQQQTGQYNSEGDNRPISAIETQRSACNCLLLEAAASVFDQENPSTFCGAQFFVQHRVYNLSGTPSSKIA
jgi:hypothetical protein